MSRGNQGSSGAGNSRRGKPGVSSLNRQPGSSSLGAGYNSGTSPYAPSIQNPGSRGGNSVNTGKTSGSLNTNVFNIPKYGQGGLGGGIGSSGGIGSGGGIGSYGSYGLGGGLGGGIGSGLGSGGR